MKKLFKFYLVLFVFMFAFLLIIQKENVNIKAYDYSIWHVHNDYTYYNYETSHSYTDSTGNANIVDLSSEGINAWGVSPQINISGIHQQIEIYWNADELGWSTSTWHTLESISLGGSVELFIVDNNGTWEMWGLTSTGQVLKSSLTLFDSMADETIHYGVRFMEDKEPVLSGETAFVTNVDNPITKTQIESHLSAIDQEDGDITHLIQTISDNYTSNMNTLGTWNIEYTVSDSSGNTATLIVQVLVKDVTPPVINGTVTYNQSYTTQKDVTTITNSLTVTDNYDTGLSHIIESNNYTPNYSVPGTYLIKYKSTDSSGNIGYLDVTINVIDDVAPTFTGPTTITKGQSEILTIADITSQLSANDVIDGVLTSNIHIVSDNYTGNGQYTGSYDIVYEVSDTSGNTTQKTVTINVLDNIPPVFFVDNYFISVSESIALTRQDIIDLLTATGQINVTSTTSLTFTMNEYEGKESEPGIYAMSLNVASNDGNEKDVSFVIKVLEDVDDGSIIVEPQVLTFWDHAWSVIVWIWNALVWLWNGILWLIDWIF